MARPRAIENPFVLHEGQFYILPDWYAGNLTNESTVTLQPLSPEETERLRSLRGSANREAYAFILPMVQRRAGIDPYAVDDDDEEGE